MVVIEVREDGSVRRVIRAPGAEAEARALDLYARLRPQIDQLERRARRAVAEQARGAA